MSFPWQYSIIRRRFGICGRLFTIIPLCRAILAYADASTAGTALDDELRLLPLFIQKQPCAASDVHASRIKQARVTFGTAKLRQYSVGFVYPSDLTSFGQKASFRRLRGYSRRCVLRWCLSHFIYLTFIYRLRSENEGKRQASLPCRTNRR